MQQQSFSFPKQTVNKIIEYATDNGISKSEVMRLACRDFFRKEKKMMKDANSK